MQNIKIELGPNNYRDDSKIPKIKFEAEFENELEALRFLSNLNSLVGRFQSGELIKGE